MGSMEKEKHLSRRQLIRTGLAISSELVLPGWILTSCALQPTKVVQTKSPETKMAGPDLGLEFDQKKWLETLQKKPVWELLPDATNKANLKCPAWSPKICLGQVSSSFRVAINRPMAEYVFSQAKMTDLPVQTDIAFIEEWGEIGPIMHYPGETRLTADLTEQNIFLWLKLIARSAFLMADKQKSNPSEYVQYFLSFYASSYLVHETGHAGAEFRILNLSQEKPSPEMFEAVHPQIYQFQKEYEELLDNAAKRGFVENALLIGVEPVVDLKTLKQKIFQEAKERGLESK